MKITFPLALGLLFIALKLTGYIAWSWLWVLAPFWLGFAIVLAVFLGIFGIAATAAIVSGSRTR